MVAFQTPRKTASTVTGSGPATAGFHTPVDASSGALQLSLPTGKSQGSHLSIEKVDASLNRVTVTGSIRGTTGSVTLASQFEAIELVADGTGSWHPTANHLPAAAVDGKVSPLQPATPFFAADYDAAGVTAAGDVWPVLELPGAGQDGPVQPSRLQIIEGAAAPGTGSAKPSGRVLHATLNPFSASSPGSLTPADGDVTGTGPYTSRVEVYGRAPIGAMSGTPALQWPDPPGSERWYGLSVLIPAGFTLATDTKWMLFTQWKGYHGGSPPLSLNLSHSNFALGGVYGGLAVLGSPVALGVWTRFVVGIKFSPDPTVGWVEIWRDGVNVLPRRQQQTLDSYLDTGDPTYLKQGIYRDESWPVTHEVFLGPIQVGATRAAVTALDVVETSPAARTRAASLATAAQARKQALIFANA